MSKGRYNNVHFVAQGWNSKLDVFDGVDEPATEAYADAAAAAALVVANAYTDGEIAGHDHDLDYAPIAKGVTNGDGHDHDGGDGAQINHTTLSNIGTNTHAQIDTFIASKAAASGLASLDAGTLVPAAQLATGTPDGTKFLRDDRSWQTITAGDADAIHDNVAGEIAAITEKASPVSADLLLIEDSADSNNKKRVQIGNLPGGGGGLSEAQVRVRVSMRV